MKEPTLLYQSKKVYFPCFNNKIKLAAGIGVYANQRTAPSTSSQPFSAQETSEKLTLAHQEHENDSSQLAKSQNNAEME